MVAVWGLVLCCLAVATPTRAQVDRLDPALVAKNGPWSGSERQEVEDYVDAQVDRLLSANEESITRAREALTNPFDTAGVTAPFKSQFSEVLAEKLGKTLKDTPLKVRINTMIVCENLTHASGMVLINEGLADENAGVRYPAAKAVAHLLAAGSLNKTQQNNVLVKLEELIDVEPDPYIVQPLLDAMFQTGDFTRTLAALNRRVDWHVARPDQSYDPERNTLFQIYIASITSGGSVTLDDVKELARASTRYFLLAAQQLNQNAVPRGNDRSHIELIRAAHTCLAHAYQKSESKVVPPKDPSNEINFRNWGEVLRCAQGWVDLLKQDPFDFTDQQLAVSEEAAANAE